MKFPHEYFVLPPIVTYIIILFMVLNTAQAYHRYGIIGGVAELGLFGIFFWLGKKWRDL